MRSFVADATRRHPVAAFLVIAFAWTWAFTMLGALHLGFALVALFGPALAAIAVARTEGSFDSLRPRLTDWRHPATLYLVALGVPFLVALVARVVLVATGHPIEGVGSVTVIELVLFVLVIGEEVGWRSFLQPRLRTRMGLGAAGVVTGVVWAAWHLPLYLTPDQGPAAFAAFAAWVVPLSVVMGLVAERVRFSAIVATAMHGAANLATPLVLPGVDRPTWLLLGGATYAIGAAGYLVLRRRRSTTPGTALAGAVR